MSSLNSRDGSNDGNLVIHPVSEGKNMRGVKDADGREFIKELGETSSWDKIVSFSHFKPWPCPPAVPDEPLIHPGN